MLHDQVQRAARDLAEKTNLFAKPWTSYDEALQAIETFRDYVENQDGWRVINRGRGKGFANEAEVQGFFGLLLQPSRFDVNREANNGRGPVDFKISMGLDNTLIEFKLAKSSSLERNMERQVAVYEKANKTNSSVFVVIGYTQTQITRVARVMTKLGLGPARCDKSRRHRCISEGVSVQGVTHTGFSLDGRDAPPDSAYLDSTCHWDAQRVAGGHGRASTNWCWPGHVSDSHGHGERAPAWRSTAQG